MFYNDFELVYMVGESEEALSLLMNKYEPLFRKMANSFVYKYPLKGLNVEDIVQQCRIILCKAVDTFSDSNDVIFYTYLLACLKWGLSSYCRTLIKRPDTVFYMGDENYENSKEFVSSCNSFELCSDLEFFLDLITFKHNLSFLDSCIFELRYNGFSYRDIASLLEINVKKVDNSLFFARKKLEKYFSF